MSEVREGGKPERELIIEKILKEKRKITLQEARDLGHRFNDYIGEVNTFVGNIDGAEHKDGETTLLYAAARRLIEEECRNTKRRLLYVLETRDSKMIAWAQTAGRKIFNWGTERVQADENYIVSGIHCEKLFLPPERK